MDKGELLKLYIRPVVHMRQQLEGRRFGLVFGSGISKPFRLPNWNELIEKIAANAEVNGEEILSYKKGSGAQASVTQMLYEHFKSQELEKLSASGTAPSKETEQRIYQNWRSIIPLELWKDFKTEYLEIGAHPFIDTYVDIVKKSSLTINYNFDDTIQTIIAKRRSDEDKRRGVKGFETVWDARLQFQSNSGIIYHPNGFLPFNLLEGSSENLVFSEDSFADQLIASMSGHYSTLLNHLSKNTCLFIGLSLDDNTLKHLLRQTAQINPGHYHYYVAFTKDKSALSDCQQKAIRESNFELYNLITLFLDDEEIRTLGELLQLDTDGFNYEVRKAALRRKFVFYLSGAVGCGKTTTLSYFRNVATFAEWPDQKPALLAKPYYDLTDDERQEVDTWIGSMFHKKNLNLENVLEGINVIDRTPLDPLTFVAEETWKEKATSLNQDISLGGEFRVVAGQIVLLKGNEDVIASRLRIRQKTIEYNEGDISSMYAKFEKAFAGQPIKVIETNELTVHEVVKRVARVIHLDDYAEIELQSILDKLIGKP